MQEREVALLEGLGAEIAGLEGGDAARKHVAFTLTFAQRHVDIIAKWGRFPHRNATLGRESTPEEVAGLADGSIGKF